MLDLDLFLFNSMKYPLTCLAILGMLSGCTKQFNGPELTEQGEVYDTAFVPKGHGSDTFTTFDSEGGVQFTPVNIKIPARYAIVFKCQHGKFVIDGERGEALYQHLSKGDSVTIRYCQVFEVSKKQTNATDLHFIWADKVKE